MYFGSPYPRFARCRVNKNRWFWVVFNSLHDELYLISNTYGYERTVVAAHLAAKQVAGF